MKQMLELTYTNGTSITVEIEELNIKNGLLTVSKKHPDRRGMHADTVQVQFIKELSVWTE